MRRKYRNPRNSENMLFKRLTRVFGGPIANYKSQTQRQFIRKDLDKYKFKSAQGLEFKKLEYDPLQLLRSEFHRNQARQERYNDFNNMEFTGEIATALDIYADEMTCATEMEPIITIDTTNEEIRFILENLFYNVLAVESNLYGWCRSVNKFGDQFGYLDVDEKMGVRNILFLPPHEVERMEGLDPNNPNYVQFQWNSGQLTFESWQIAHFRHLDNDSHAPYGTSILDNGRRAYRQLVLIEEAMMSYRIVRAPERRVFYIDVGAMPTEDIEQFMQNVKNNLKRNFITDPDDGRVDLRYNPPSIEEDIYIPIRNGAQNTRVEQLPGGQYTGDIDDVKYIREKLITSLKIPHSYLLYSENSAEEKGSLAQKDIRFARTIRRLQRNIEFELARIAKIHLFVLGFRGKDLQKFTIRLPNAGKIAELQELERWRSKFDLADAATEGYFSKAFIYKNVFNMSDEEVQREKARIKRDAIFASEIEAAASGEMAGGGGGGDFGGGEESPFDTEGGDDFTGDADMPDSPEEEDVLLAAPPKRDARRYTASSRKGGRNYVPSRSGENSTSGRRRSSLISGKGHSDNSLFREEMKKFDEMGFLDKKENSQLLKEEHEIAEERVKALKKKFEEFD